MSVPKKYSRKNYFTLRLAQFQFFHLRSNKKAKLLNGSSVQPSTAGEINNNNGNCQRHISKSNGSQQISYGKSVNHYQHNTTTNVSVSNSPCFEDGGQTNIYQQLQSQHQIYGCSSAEDHYELTQAHYAHNSSNSVAAGSRPNGPNLVNKHLVLPFVPPSFPNKSLDGITHLIKPSEYLKSISDKRSCPSSARSTDTEDYMQIQVSNQHQISFEPPKPPPPPPLPMTPLLNRNTINSKDRHNTTKPITNPHTQQNNHNPQDTTTRKQHQPLSAISIQDLNSVQLRRTDTQKVPKPFQMPARSLSMQCLSSGSDTYLKTDLIAELKISKDIPGIKKMKVEQQMANRFDSEHYSELTKQFTADNYVDQIYFQIPEKDQAGNVIPDWKRQMMAKKAAEKAKKEFEERMAKEAENRRLSQIPQWKRELLARREETENKLRATIYTPKIEENNRVADSWRMKNRALSIDNISLISCSAATDNITDKENAEDNNSNSCAMGQTLPNSDSNPLTNSHDTQLYLLHQQQQQQVNNPEETDNIIPWRAQLRKTNSRLSLI